MGFSKECKEMSVHTPLNVMALDKFFPMFHGKACFKDR